MKTIINLKDLLKHEILDLYSAEEQIIENLPGMIERANKPELKEVMSKLLELCNIQKNRLNKIKENLEEKGGEDLKTSFFSNLFGGINHIHSKGIEGLIKESKKIMEEEMTSETMDAAILGSLQKIGHYMIAGYGTVRAYSLELNLELAAIELKKCLYEQYNIDDSLTKLAVVKINPDSENAVKRDEDQRRANEADFNLLSDSVSIMSTSDDSER